MRVAVAAAIAALDQIQVVEQPKEFIITARDYCDYPASPRLFKNVEPWQHKHKRHKGAR